MREILRRALCLAVAALLLGAASNAAANPCAIPADETGALASVDLSGEDSGLGGTGIRGDDSGLGGTGFRGDDSGLGGTGIRGDDSGVGGTGLASDSGIGGTGISSDSGIGGTGIFGTVTAFGSVCVNGLRVHYPSDTEVWVNGMKADASALRVGQVVWIVATTRDGRLETNRIAVHSAVTGRIEAIDVANRRLRVAGRDVWVPNDSRVIVRGANERRGFASLRTGQNVDVSGLPNVEGAVVASRVVVVSEVPQVSSAPVRIGDLVSSTSGIERLSIEGYVARRIRADRVLVDGLEIDLSGRPEHVGRIDRGARIRATGRLAPDGSLRVERALNRPPSPGVKDSGATARTEPEPPVETPIDEASVSVPRDVVLPTPIEPANTDRPESFVRPTVPRIDRPEPLDIPKIDRPDRLSIPKVDSLGTLGR